ncbi:MAG: tetratricopeptide repeat protein [Gemmatimonadaceae bacterium]
MADTGRLDELQRKFDENPKRYFAPLANEYRKAGQPDVAIELCRTYLPQQPTHMSGYIVYGQALHDAGHAEESAAVFKQALTLDPENIIALRHLGDISRDAGDSVGAMRWYGKVLELDPRNEEIAAYITSLAQPGTQSGTQSGIQQRQPEWPIPPTVRPEPAPDASAVSLEDIVAQPDAEQQPISPEQLVYSHTEVALEIQHEEAFEVTGWPSGLDPLHAPESQLEKPESDDQESVLAGPWHSPAPAADAEQQHELAPPAADSSADLSAKTATDAHAAAEEPSSAHPAPAEEPKPTAETVAPVRRESSPFVTETMAELYLRQGLHGEALAVYRELLILRDDPALRQKIAHVEAQQAAASPHETVRQFFERIGAMHAQERVEMAAERQSSLGSLFGSDRRDQGDVSAAERLSSAFGKSASGALRS